MVPQEKPLDSLGPLFPALETFLEGQLSEYRLPPNPKPNPHWGKDPHIHVSSCSFGWRSALLPPRPTDNLPSVLRGPRSLGKPQHQPPAPCFSVPAAVRTLGDWITHLSGICPTGAPTVSIFKIPTSKTILMDLLEFLAWSKII